MQATSVDHPYKLDALHVPHGVPSAPPKPPEAPSPSKKPNSEPMGATVLVIIIVVFMCMLVFGAVTSKGMYQYGCSTNASALTFFLYNIVNSMLMGIPGLISAIHFKDTTFVVKN